MALTATAAVAGTAAVASYLEGKFQLRRDLGTLRSMQRARRDYQKSVKENRISLWYQLDQVANKTPNNRAIWSRTGSYTFRQFHDQACRYAQWLLQQGVRPGDLVAFYLQNSAEFLMIWFGLLAIGAAPAFLNHNLDGDGVLHCLKVCNTKLLLVDEDEGCRKRIYNSCETIQNRGIKIVDLSPELKKSISASVLIVPADEYRENIKGEDPCTLIYTSGTTGLPKASAMWNQRVRLTGYLQQPAFAGKPGVDCWYNPMPLYHGTGSLSCFTALLSGIGVAIARRFSVSGFWDDVHDSQSTFIVYVGETSRYLLNAPPHPRERDHQLRCAYGNGMRPDVWDKFQQRFNIPEIAEFFNSTEGMFALVNWDRGSYQVDCVGHHGLVLRTLLRNTFIPVMVDHGTGDIWRDPKTGFAKRMPYEIGGEMIVAVPNKKAFQGYWDDETATDKKFCTDVFKKGDIYYRSGDALRRDPDGRWFFLDRLGDTFRWKSENVSTTEVAQCLGRYPGIAEANVYGVLVPNHEGRAGCAAIHVDPHHQGRVDYDDMLRYVRQTLPRYAVPVFLRLVKASSHIHNHKQDKVPLRKEGVDPRLVGTEVKEGKDDVLLWLPPKSSSYVEFGQRQWDDLNAGQARL